MDPLTELLGPLAGVQPRVVEAVAGMPLPVWDAELADPQLRRDRLVLSHAGLLARIDHLDDKLDGAAGQDPAYLRVLEQELEDMLAVEELVHGAYVAQLPEVTLSRCPFSGAPFEMAIDFRGLDGPWWRYEHPARAAAAAPQRLLLLSGAMALDTTLAPADFLVMPGPGAPFVLPALLANGAVQAVLSALPVGRHTGFAVCYFTEDAALQPTHPEWGRPDHLLDRHDPAGARVSVAEDVADYDFVLAPWLAAGRLKWIMPGDDGFALREGTADCPFLDLPGPRRLQYVQYGRAWQYA